ncbi:hypothetical protein FA13DRAFT_1644284, partial [Coprinellus micaceus]
LHLGYVVALFVCGTIHAAANSWINIVAWNDVPLYPGGALAWAAASYGHPVFMLSQVPFLMTMWLADGCMTYRCWVVYSTDVGRWIFLLPPGLLYLGSIGTGLILLCQMSNSSNSLYSRALTGTILANFAITTLLNVLLTGLIAIRLAIHIHNMRRYSCSDDGSMRAYTSVWGILIESSALYAIFSLMFMVTYALNHPASQMFLGFQGQVQVVAALLIALRVSRGTAWARKTVRQAADAASAIKFRSHTRSGQISAASAVADSVDACDLRVEVTEVRVSGTG